MRHFRLVFSVATMLVLGAGLLLAQDKEGKKGRSKRPGGGLSPMLRQLDLSEEQAQKVRDIHAKHSKKIDELRKQLGEAIKAERKEIDGVLTEKQRAKAKRMMDEGKAKAKARRKGPDR